MKIPGNSSLRHTIRLIAVCAAALASQLPAQSTGSQQQEIQFYRDSGIQPLVNADQGGDLAPGTYLIPHDIIVAKGKVLSLYPGTRILLTQNAMLVVNGTLVCAGSDDAPIEFRKLDNQKYYQPIDPRVETRWDGIYLPDSAVLKMRNTIISDSKYGIVISGKDVSMVFESVRFVNNKFQNVKIGDRMMKITENTPVNFHYPEQEGVFVEPAAVLNVTETIQQKKGQPHVTEYRQLRVVMGVCAGVGALFLGAGVYAHNKYQPLYDETVLTDDETQMKHYRTRLNAGVASGITGGLLFGIGAVGFTWTLFF